MQIQQLEIYTRHLAAQHQFYAGVLELPLLQQSSKQLVFQAGHSRLVLRQSDRHEPYHFAFNTHPDGLAQAKNWLQQKLSFIPDLSGQTEFFLEDWNAHNFYFRDTEGNILECIARHNLPHTLYGQEGHPVKAISEIGWATPDVLGTVAYLETFGLKPYQGTSSTFTAVGDEHGLVIVVQQERIWFPQTGVAAKVAPFNLIGQGFMLEYPQPDR